MKKNSLLFFLAFLGGVIFANVMGIVSGRELGAMNEYFLNRYMYADVQGQELFPYLFYKRVPAFLLLVILSVGLYKTLIVDGYICYLAFSVGFLSVIAFMNYEIRGILLIPGFFLPQWLFYAPVLFLWRYGLEDFKVGKEHSFGEQKGGKHVKFTALCMAAGVLLLAGIFLESYVNPALLLRVIRILG